MIVHHTFSSHLKMAHIINECLQCKSHDSTPQLLISSSMVLLLQCGIPNQQSYMKNIWLISEDHSNMVIYITSMKIGIG